MALEEARRKLGPFNFENLPLDRNDGIWAELRSPPYSLDLEELSALKNARCTQAPDPIIETLRAVSQGFQDLNAFLRRMTGKKEQLSHMGDSAASRLKTQFTIARVEDIDAENFDFLPLPDGCFGSDENFEWGRNGEDKTNTNAFHERLRASCNLHTLWGFANVSGRQLFSCCFTQGDREYKYGGRTDLAVLPQLLCARKQTKDTIIRNIRMVIELKTPDTYVAGDNQIIGELLLALFSSELNDVHGALTSGNLWKFYWLVRSGRDVIIRRCEVQGWINGVRHLLAMLNRDVQNNARLVPYLGFPSSVTDDNNDDDDYSNESEADESEDPEGNAENNRRVRPRYGEVDRGADVTNNIEQYYDPDDMEDWYDADGNRQLRNEQLMQKIVWATHRLPEFAQLRSNDRLTENSLSLHSSQSFGQSSPRVIV